MGGLMEPAVEAAVEAAVEVAVEVAVDEAKKETVIDDIRSLMETLNFTAKQAMDALKIPADKQKEFILII